MMLSLARDVAPLASTSVADELQLQRRRWWRVYLQAVLLSLVLGALAYRSAPHPFTLTVLIYLLAALWILLRPIVGVYLITVFTLLGDAVVAPWYPFTKNLSSRESISFLDDRIPITPLELFLGVTFVALVLKTYATHSWAFQRGVLFAPVIVFAALLAFGFGRGIASGGNLRIALFEARPVFCLPVMYVLCANLLTTRAQYVRLLVVALVAILGQSLIAIQYYRGLDAIERSDLDRLTEHAASVPLAMLIVLVLASLLFAGVSTRLRALLLLMVVPCTIVFGLSQRRSGVIALAVGLVMLLTVMWKLRPRVLVWLVPVLVAAIAAYTVAFWNTNGSVGFGAQAIKSVIAPDQLDTGDRSSNFYRGVESYNLWFTIRTSPLSGVGFGNVFYQPWRMPYLEGFEFRDWIPHNSMLWLWLKTGFAGFVTFLYLVARALQHGARHVIAVGRGDQAVLAMGAVAYVLMFCVFAYVDIAFDARSMILLAICFAWCADAARLPRPVASSTSTEIATLHDPAPVVPR